MQIRMQAHVPVSRSFLLDTSTHAVLVLRHRASPAPIFTTTLAQYALAAGADGIRVSSEVFFEQKKNSTQPSLCFSSRFITLLRDFLFIY